MLDAIKYQRFAIRQSWIIEEVTHLIGINLYCLISIVAGSQNIEEFHLRKAY